MARYALPKRTRLPGSSPYKIARFQAVLLPDGVWYGMITNYHGIVRIYGWSECQHFGDHVSGHCCFTVMHIALLGPGGF